ncbi:MAG: PAS domain-containing sensor histidine kinase, partial [Bacteroidota bacterium]
VPGGTILSANPAACKMFMCEESEFIGLGRYEILDITDTRAQGLINHRRLTGQASGELRFKRKDGSIFPGQVNSVIFLDSEGEERTSMYIRDLTESKKAEEEIIATNNALQSALNDLNKIMNSSIDVICTFNSEGKFINVSDAAKEVWGYSTKELKNKKCYDLMHKEDVERTKSITSQILNGEHIHTYENRFINKNGEVINMLWSAKWDENEELMYSIAKDITEKKQLELAFEDERERFHDLFLQAPSCIGILKGPNHVFEMANPLYLKLINKTDIIGKPAAEVLPELEFQGFIDLLNNVYSTGKTFSAEEAPVKLDRSGTGILEDVFLNFFCQPYRSAQGITEGIFFFILDVTDQVMSGRKIEQSEQRYRQIVETAQEGIWKMDELNRTNFVNNKMCEIMEYNRSEMLGREIFYFMDEESRKEAANKIIGKSAAFTDRFSLKLISKSGKTIWTSISANALYDEDGAYKGLLAMVTDTTERKQAEAERTKLLNDLVLRNRDLEQFAYIISHNLRGPISNIIGASNLLTLPTISEEGRNVLTMGLSESINKLDSVVTDLNHILKVKSETDEAKESVSFSQLVEDVKFSIKNLVDKDSISISYDFEDVDILFTIKSYLYSIFYNLISNSIKYRQPDIPCKIEIKSFRNNDSIELEFRDNGLGIDLQKRGSQVFGLYKRFHKDIEGKGMGLYMVKTQVETLGGKIKIESEVNVGTTFTIEF